MESIVMFGCGNVCNSVLAYIKKNYNILFLVDSNSTYWNTYVSGIPVYSPSCLNGYKGMVIVSTTDKYFEEICVELSKYDIDRTRIVRCQHCYYDQKEEIVPYTEGLISLENHSATKLEDYDMLHKIESHEKLNIMIFCAFYSIYTIQLIKNIKKIYPDIRFSVISNSEQYFSDLSNYVEHLYVYHSYVELKDLLQKIPIYDVFQFLWIENIWVYFRNIIRRKCRKLNICVGGSDFYRATNTELEYKKMLIDMSDCISAETYEIIKKFVAVYPETKSKISQVNFGLDVLESIDNYRNNRTSDLRKEFGIPNDKIILTCGHNANPAHQHIKIINALLDLSNEYKSKIHLVFPMTYPEGQMSYINEVRNRLNNSGYTYTILEEYMSRDSISKYVCVSDIMLHMQITDQLSSFMLEAIYAGNIVINGKWLKYDMLKEFGVKMFDADWSNMIVVLRNVIDGCELVKMESQINRKIIFELSDWSHAAKKWMKLWR